MTTKDFAIIWQKFLHSNGDISNNSKAANICNIRKGKKQLKNTEQRITELFTMQDAGTFINCCLEMQKEFADLQKGKSKKTKKLIDKI